MDQQTDKTSEVSLWSRIRERLEKKQRRIYEEIREYPRPIAGCDAQFNHLLEERANISQELARLNDAIESCRRGGDPLKVIDAFVRSSPYLSNERC